MRLYLKLAIGSASALVFIVSVGFLIFPKMISSKIKSMVNLGPGTDIREMFVTIPFPLEFRVYLFNVTNPMEIQNGAKPIVKEVGPFCYEEWKKKVNIEDMEINDTISYNPVDTFLKTKYPGCKTGKEQITIPHPLILGIVNTVSRQKPGALSLVNKAFKSIYSNPTSIFITETADNILFDGIVINCGVKDFAGKAICGQLRDSSTLRKVSDDELAFSLFGPVNGTEGKKFQALRGTKNFRNVGKIVQYNDEETMDVWLSEECNIIKGTDGTVFPPFLKKEQGLVSFAPNLCRSLEAYFVEDTKYDGIPVRHYTANLGDMSKNEKEKCYCYTPETCMKKGMMDLYKCSSVPIYASLPHFYDCHESYLRLVDGLAPNKTKHSIKILFESMTGGPVYAKKRLQFSMPVVANEKVELFKNLSESILPIFWIEEGIALNNTYTKPIKDLFMLKKIVTIAKWMILVLSLIGLCAAGYLYFKQENQVEITPVEKNKNSDQQNTISRILAKNITGQDNIAMSNNGLDKYY